jgi:hypothetical protein
MLLVTTGGLGTDNPPGEAEGWWIQSRNGKYYEPHDIGSVGLMLPAALASAFVSRVHDETIVEVLPITAIVGVSLTCALLSAVTCLFMYNVFLEFHGRRGAFFLSLAFPTTTFLWTYCKSAWDVLGACCFMSALLFYSARLLRGGKLRREALFAGIALALACSFRFSLAPFFVPCLAVVLCLSPGVPSASRPRSEDGTNTTISGDIRSSRPRSRPPSTPRPTELLRRLPWKGTVPGGRWLGYTLCAIGFLAMMLPELVYNDLRMGSVFKPGTAHASYLEGNNALTGNIAEGLFGLLFAPNRGLFLYSPIFLLLFVLPSVWHRVTQEQRRLILVYGAGGALYLLMIAKMKTWGAFGWGPRYLVPVVPILFFAASRVLAICWERHKRPLAALVILSGLLSAAPVLVNWNLATTEFPHAAEQDSKFPYQQMAVWKCLLMGLEGKPLPAPPKVVDDPIRSAGRKFPDLWTVRLIERGHWGLGIGILLMLIVPGALSFLHLGRNE